MIHFVLHSYIHQTRIGVLLEMSAETDFAARTDTFQRLLNDIALQIAGAAPATVEALLRQRSVRDESVEIRDVLDITAKALGERIAVHRFVRWEAGGAGDPACDPTPPRSPAVALRSA